VKAEVLAAVAVVVVVVETSLAATKP
jgi:hypothetical protein